MTLTQRGGVGRVVSGWHCWGAYVIPSPLACPGCLGAGGERDVAKAEGRLSTCCLRRN